ncbi:MAG TPA: hypothetical protein VK169_14295 [Saprospiraceae bacterium]|nr:hypothetical protein [Saprospiraceae bacterium]
MTVFFLWFSIYWILIAIQWFNSYSFYTKPFNYIFISFTTLLITTFISFSDYINDLIDPNSHIKNKDRNDNIIKISEKIKREKLIILYNTIEDLNSILSIEQPLELNILGYKGWGDGINDIYKDFPANLRSGDYCYSINNTTIKLIISLEEVYTRSHTTRLEIKTWIKTRLQYLPCNYIINEIIMRNPKLFNPRQLDVFDKKEILSFIKKVLIRAEKEKYYEERIASESISFLFEDFLFNNFFLFMGVGGNLIIPNSFFTKLNRLFLGILKFIVIGALVLVFIQN